MTEIKKKLILMLLIVEIEIATILTIKAAL